MACSRMEIDATDIDGPSAAEALGFGNLRGLGQ